MSTWNIDSAHTEIAFKIRHLAISNVRGTFNKFTGKIVTSDDTLADAKISFEAETASADTRQEQRDAHLKTAEFFDVEKFPTMSFESTSFMKMSENMYEVKGMLTLKGVSKEVTLEAQLHGFSQAQDGKRLVGFEVTTKISRKEFGFVLNAGLEMALGDVVTLEANVELKEE